MNRNNVKTANLNQVKRYENPFRDLPSFSKANERKQNGAKNEEKEQIKVVKLENGASESKSNKTINSENDDFGLSKIIEEEKKLKKRVLEKEDTQPDAQKRKREMDQPKEKAKPEPVDTEAALQKIKPFLCKPKKFKKAAQLMMQLINAHLADETSELFFDAFFEVMQGCTAVDFFTQPEVKEPSVSLFSSLERKRDVFFLDSQQFELTTWYLRAVVSNELNTDDTYQFSRRCKMLKEVLEEMDNSYEPLQKRRKDAILLCMDVAFKSYGHAWAKVSIEAAFKVARDKRLMFQEHDRDKVDSFTTDIVKAKGKPANAGLKTVRTLESIAHPLRNKATSILR